MTDQFRPDQQAEDDLTWLMAHGAADGVAAIMHERRRQIEQLGWTPEHDREHHRTMGLLPLVSAELIHRVFPRIDRAGALLAAEIDRRTVHGG